MEIFFASIEWPPTFRVNTPRAFEDALRMVKLKFTFPTKTRDGLLDIYIYAIGARGHVTSLEQTCAKLKGRIYRRQLQWAIVGRSNMIRPLGSEMPIGRG